MVMSKRPLDVDVYTLAKERVRKAFEMFDEVRVQFSGGKDSSAVLNVTLEVAHELGKLPVKVDFWDEEVISPDTVDYVRRVSQRPDVELRWLCVPLKHPNACSRREPWWYQWDPADQWRWARELPPEAVTHEDLGWRVEDVREIDIFHSAVLLCQDDSKTYGLLLGIRAEESIARYWRVAHRQEDNWITPSQAKPNVYLCRPIYDWTVRDIWTATYKFGWDYNRSYDKMTKLGVPMRQQRVTVPFHQLTYVTTWYFPKIWPEFWERALDRVPGARAAVLYNHTSLYSGIGRPKEGYTWQDLIRYYLNRWPPRERKILADYIQSLIRSHYRYRKGPIPEDEPGYTVTWKRLALIAKQGDFEKRNTMYTMVRSGEGEL